ncbi:MAG: integrase [Clostridia bacterium]|jgi:integrase|nr:integrase [Clostridia bacterium]
MFIIRLPNGHGTVYKLSGKRRKPWIARITTGWDAEGKQLFQTIGYFKEKTEALDALTLHRVNPVSPKSNITLKELYDEWSIAKYEYISKSTVDGYKAAWKYLSKFENAKFKELRTSHIQSVIDGYYKSKMSRSSLEKIKAVATMLYSYALENDIVNKSYAEFLRLPKSEKEEKEIFTDLEIQKIEKNVGEVEWLDTVLILIYSGMRISELLELTKFSLDMDKQLITGGVKTDAGKNRVIPIHPKIFPLIKKWYDKNGERLICTDEGKSLSVDYFRRKKYYIALEKIGVRKLSPHACRHTFASLMAKAGVDTLYIQKIIGHEDYATTANLYTHTDVDELKKAIGKI